MNRREFLAVAAGETALAAAVVAVAANKLAPTDEQERHPDHPALQQVAARDVHVGTLMGVLRKGGSASVWCPNPYHPGWGVVYAVHAGPYFDAQVAECGWPVGQPVAFALVGERFETVGF